jgi:Bacterial regulatory protein, Fis family
LLEVGVAQTRPLRLHPGRSLTIGDHEEWQVKIVRVGDGIVEVRVFGGAAVRVNDVQVRTVASARAGDLIALPDRSLLVQHFSRLSPPPPEPWSHEAFEQRFHEEVNTAAPKRGAVSLLIVRSRSLRSDGLAEFLSAPELNAQRERGRSVIVGRAAPTTLELLLPAASSTEADEIREQLSEALGRLGRPFRWGWASTPTDAVHPATLWGRALDRLFADSVEPAEDLPHMDPVMSRLWSLGDVWAEMKGGILLQAEVGSGRETLARVIHERRTPQAPFIVVKSPIFESSLWRASVDRASGGSLYVRHLGGLSASERSSFWNATAFRPMAGEDGNGGDPQIPRIVIPVPALRDRPLDILPIADHVLARCSSFDGSWKLKLTPAARSAFSREWLGSVRELKNSLQRAALLVEASGEVQPEHCVSALAGLPRLGPRRSDLRASLQSMERAALLDALGRTNWNVTAAARVLGLPRRTIVYRMSRLGLRRSTSSVR